MRFLIYLFSFVVTQSALAKENKTSPVTFTDRVYKVETVKDKAKVSFRLHAAIYEIPIDSVHLKNFQESIKNKKPVRVSVDPITKKIVDVKGP